jgi:hypothetical protein
MKKGKRMKTQRLIDKMQTTLAVALAVAFGFDAWAGMTTAWTNNSGVASSWFITGNWTNGVPTIADTANIWDNTAGKRSIVLVDGAAEASTVNMRGSRTNTLIVAANGSLKTTGSLLLGYGAGTIALVEFSGPVTIATLDVANFGGSTGIVTQRNNSAVTVTNQLWLSHNSSTDKGYYTLESGSLTISSQLYVGAKGYGEFLQKGGSVTGKHYIAVGAQSAGGSGLYRQEGGWAQDSASLWVGSTSGTGRYELVGGVYTNGGGYGELVGGVLSGSAPSGENGGQGTFEQSGGTNYARQVRIGYMTNGTPANVATPAVGYYRISGGLLQDAGLLQVGGQTAGTGTFEVVGSRATIKAGSYAQYPGSTLSVTVSNGIAPIQVSGNAVLAGNLRISLVGPRPATKVSILSYASHSGTFDSITYDPPGLNIPVLYENDGVKLRFSSGTLISVQ